MNGIHYRANFFISHHVVVLFCVRGLSRGFGNCSSNCYTISVFWMFFKPYANLALVESLKSFNNKSICIC